MPPLCRPAQPRASGSTPSPTLNLVSGSCEGVPRFHPEKSPRLGQVTAAWWLFAFLGLNAAGATNLFVLGGGLSDGFLTGLGRLAGLYGAIALVLPLLLISRLPWLETRLGMARLT